MHCDDELPDARSWSRSEEDEALAYMGALAASIGALEPELQLLAARVRWALSLFEERFAGDDASANQRYELDRYPTGAAALYDAVVDLAEVLAGAVAGLGVRAGPVPSGLAVGT